MTMLLFYCHPPCGVLAGRRMRRLQGLDSSLGSLMSWCRRMLWFKCRAADEIRHDICMGGYEDKHAQISRAGLVMPMNSEETAPEETVT